MMLGLLGCESFEDYKSKDSNVITEFDSYIIENDNQKNKRDLNKSSTYIRKSEINLNKQKMIETCKKLVLSNVPKQKTVSFNENLRGNYYINQKTGDVYLYLEFCAENEQGNAQEFKGKCVFSIDGQTQVNIFE
ncbi:hypothetical protein F993_01004 [Acinetobacter proteolyticus]|jgi:hypothetical protein|uniref:Lipoprotein n=2 Tax=Acinetobacter proteolyticus TaxID=1776741 RepID=A0ABP2TQU8_9GAMM|nr:hypothetical protein F993_01004 [Acinetobacter proteolyticus]OJU72421.1 MAG: hypothetical protein BGN93_13630 [Acinetobacter sp. 39-4]